MYGSSSRRRGKSVGDGVKLVTGTLQGGYGTPSEVGTQRFVSLDQRCSYDS